MPIRSNDSPRFSYAPLFPISESGKIAYETVKTETPIVPDASVFETSIAKGRPHGPEVIETTPYAPLPREYNFSVDSRLLSEVPSESDWSWEEPPVDSIRRRLLAILDSPKRVNSVAAMMGKEEHMIAEEFSSTSSIHPIQPVPVASGSLHFLSLVAKRTIAHMVALSLDQRSRCTYLENSLTRWPV